MLMLDLSRRHAFSDEHTLFRDQVRRFLERELVPISTAGKSRASSIAPSGT